MRITFEAPEAISQVIEEFVPINKRIRNFNIHHTLCMAVISFTGPVFYAGKITYETLWVAKELEKMRRLGVKFEQSPSAIRDHFVRNVGLEESLQFYMIKNKEKIDQEVSKYCAKWGFPNQV